VGRVAEGSEQKIEIPVVANAGRGFFTFDATAEVTSATALPVKTNYALTYVAK
jgi:hypothetical protein